MKVTKANAATVYQLASTAAKYAAELYSKKYGEGPMNCGFAWVDINPATGPMVQYLKSIGVGRKGYPKGYTIWDPSNSRTQDMSIKEAGAQAFAQVMREYGVNCYAGSRLD